MQAVAVVSGVVSLLAAGALSGLGVHDGLLSESELGALPATGDPLPVTVRLLVLDHARAADALVERLAPAQGSVSFSLALLIELKETETLTPVQIIGYEPPGKLPVLARMTGSSDPGARWVAEGTLTLYYVLVEGEGGPVGPEPVVILDVQERRQPVLFA